MTTRLKEELVMTHLTSYLACFIQLVNGNLTGIVVTYLQNTNATGNLDFEERSRLKERVFESKKRTMIHLYSDGLRSKKQGISF